MISTPKHKWSIPDVQKLSACFKGVSVTVESYVLSSICILNTWNILFLLHIFFSFFPRKSQLKLFLPFTHKL